MSVLLEVIDISNLIRFLLWVIIPLFMVLYGYVAKKFFCTTHLVYLFFSAFAIGIWQGIQFWLLYLAIIGIFAIWWSRTFYSYRMNNPEQYEEYMHFYSEYFSDDLNNDGIKDAFEHWEIAHDPRFFWIFASKKAKAERRERLNRKASEARYYSQESQWKNRNDRGYGKDYSERVRSEDWNTYGRNRGGKTYEGAYQQRSQRDHDSKYDYSSNRTERDYSKTNDYSNMSEAEKAVAKQHAFARKYNLSYFAMCSSKDEAKKLYRKYATKFHPDNPTTGDKDKFIRIDEEYNRFCKIPEIS